MYDEAAAMAHCVEFARPDFTLRVRMYTGCTYPRAKATRGAQANLGDGGVVGHALCRFTMDTSTYTQLEPDFGSSRLVCTLWTCHCLISKVRVA